jgi:hypothetical protein
MRACHESRFVGIERMFLLIRLFLDHTVVFWYTQFISTKSEDELLRDRNLLNFQ